MTTNQFQGRVGALLISLKGLLKVSKVLFLFAIVSLYYLLRIGLRVCLERLALKC
jgi:hypothetical protein